MIGKGKKCIYERLGYRHNRPYRRRRDNRSVFYTQKQKEMRRRLFLLRVLFILQKQGTKG